MDTILYYWLFLWWCERSSFRSFRFAKSWWIHLTFLFLILFRAHLIFGGAMDGLMVVVLILFDKPKIPINSRRSTVSIQYNTQYCSTSQEMMLYVHDTSCNRFRTTLDHSPHGFAGIKRWVKLKITGAMEEGTRNIRMEVYPNDE